MIRRPPRSTLFPTRRSSDLWSHGGIVCTGETYQKVVKLTFAKGAALKDPARLFNSSLEGNTRRAIDIQDRKSTRLNSSHVEISYAVFCLKKKKKKRRREERT